MLIEYKYTITRPVAERYYNVWN